MARGRKKKIVNIEDQLNILEQEMAALNDKIKDLKGKKAELMSAKEQEDLKKIYEFIKQSGKSIEDVITNIQNV